MPSATTLELPGHDLTARFGVPVPSGIMKFFHRTDRGPGRSGFGQHPRYSADLINVFEEDPLLEAATLVPLARRCPHGRPARRPPRPWSLRSRDCDYSASLAVPASLDAHSLRRRGRLAMSCPRRPPSLSFVSGRFFLVRSCSHTRQTDQPAASRALWCRLSLWMLPAIFGSQYSLLDRGSR
jgi:hypothetical protein